MARHDNPLAGTNLSEPATHAAEITPDNDEDLAFPTRAIYVGTSGDLKVTMTEGETVTLANCPAGIIPLRVKRIFATGTAASDIVGLW